MEEEQVKKRKARTRNSEIHNKKYECPCGRKYLSYSALYTHSKQKHGITITTRAFENRPDTKSEIRLRSQPFQQPKPLNQKQVLQFQEQIAEQKNIQMVILAYITEQTKSQHTYLCWVFDQLIICINSNPDLLEPYELSENYTIKKSAELVPLIFNFFLIDYCPKTMGMYYQKHRDQMKKIIHEFGSWLFNKNHTLYEIRLNTDDQ